MTFQQCDMTRYRICGSHPKEGRSAGIGKNRTSNMEFSVIPDQCKMISTTIENSDIVVHSQTAMTTIQLPSNEEIFYDEPAFEIRIEVIKKSLRQDDNAESSQIRFYFLFYTVLCNII